MDNSSKKKLIMFFAMIGFLVMYMLLFGSKNAVIGIMIILATFMNLGNDLSFKPKLSFIKVLILLLSLGIAAFLNNPISIFGCILTFIVVFATTYTSYHLYQSDVYMPFLMCYFMMLCIPVTLNELSLRLLSLVVGAVFFVGLNILINKKKDYKLSKQTVETLVLEINNAIDLKLNGEEVSKESFKTVNGFYSSLFSKFEYRFVPSPVHESVLNVVKSFQYIGVLLADYNLSENELIYLKETLSKIRNITSEDIFKGIEIETKEMNLILLNLEIISNEIHKDLDNDYSIQDKKTVKASLKPISQRILSFRSVKFTFAFKMAIVLTLWEVLTLIFNLPYAKWLYFASIPLMLPYVDDMRYNVSSRILGTVIGVIFFAVILFVTQFIPLPTNILSVILLIICMFGMISNIQDKLKMTIYTTIMSVMVSLMYISPEMAIPLKIIWVVVAVIVVSIINIGFLPYSVEKETENNLAIANDLNRKSISLIKDKCLGNNSYQKTTVLVLSNIVRENININDGNRKLYQKQVQITDICNFILNYLDVHNASDKLKKNLLDIIDNNGDVLKTLEVRERIISYSMNHVMELYELE